MKETPNPPPIDPDTTITDFKIAGRVVRVVFSRKRLSQLRPLSMCGVSVKFDNPIIEAGTAYPIIVFPTRLTATLDLEQTGSGIPCREESQANNVVQVIQGKNQTVPHVVMASVPGTYFGIATSTNVDLSQDELVLFKFHVAKETKGQNCGFALRLYKCSLDKPRQLTYRCRVISTGATQSVGIADAETGADRGHVTLRGGKCDRVRVGSAIKVEGMGLTAAGRIREPRCTEKVWLVKF
jgi:hypothetical protein